MEPSAIIDATPHLIGSVTNWIQFLTFLVLLVAGVSIMWIREGSATSKRVIARDAQIAEIKMEIADTKRTSDGIGRTLDEHLMIHDKWDNKVDLRFDNQDKQLVEIYRMVHDIDKRLSILSFKDEYETSKFQKNT